MPQDKTPILNVSSHERKKKQTVQRYDMNVYDEVHNSMVVEKYGFNECTINDNNSISQLSEFLNFSWAQSAHISEFSLQCVGYIAGWVILTIKKQKKIKCLECILACEENNPQNIVLNSNNSAAYIAAVTRGYLVIPSQSVIRICTIAESLFRKAINTNCGKPPTEQNFPAVLAAKVFQQAVETHDIFLELEDHNVQMLSAEEFIIHAHQLTKTIIICYIELRMYAETKKHALRVTGTNLRHFLTRSIIWAHQ